MGSDSGKDAATGLIMPYGGHNPEIADGVYIAPGAVVIGDVVIGEGSSVWFNTVLRGDFNEIRVGRGTNIQDGAVVHVSSYGSGTYIGDDVNDLALLEEVGFSATPNDANNAIKEHVDYVCSKDGGKGAFREISDLIIFSKFGSKNLY